VGNVKNLADYYIKGLRTKTAVDAPVVYAEKFLEANAAAIIALDPGQTQAFAMRVHNANGWWTRARVVGGRRIVMDYDSLIIEAIRRMAANIKADNPPRLYIEWARAGRKYHEWCWQLFTYAENKNSDLKKVGDAIVAAAERFERRKHLIRALGGLVPPLPPLESVPVKKRPKVPVKKPA
jgi:hypothetical protein